MAPVLNLKLEFSNQDLKRLDTRESSNKNQNRWLNDKIISSFSYLIQERSNLLKEKDGNALDVHIFDPFFFGKWLIKGEACFTEFGLRDNLNLFLKDLVLMPIHKKNHYTLGVVWPKLKAILHLDSLQNSVGIENKPPPFAPSSNIEILNLFAAHYKALNIDQKCGKFQQSEWKILDPKSINQQDLPKQKNSIDCGVFLLAYMDCLTRELPFNFSQEDIIKFRQDIQYFLRNSSKNLDIYRMALVPLKQPEGFSHTNLVNRTAPLELELTTQSDYDLVEEQSQSNISSSSSSSSASSSQTEIYYDSSKSSIETKKPAFILKPEHFKKYPEINGIRCKEHRIKWVMYNEGLTDNQLKRQVAAKEGDDYHAVKRITNWMRDADGVLWYEVEWKEKQVKKEDQRKWVYEKNLDGCYAMLVKFLEERQKAGDKDIPPISIVPRVGAISGDKQYNENNWVPINLVMEEIERVRKTSGYDKSIDVQVFINNFQRRRDGLYLYIYQHHLLVFLYLYQQRMAYASDGSNILLVDSNLREEFQLEMRIKIVPVLFNQQTKLDHCGSSGVAIGLEFLRLYKHRPHIDQYISNGIWCPSKLILEIKNKFHKEKSETMQKFHIKNSPWKKCIYCPKSFRGSSNTLIVAHQKKCSKNPNRI